MTENNSVPCSVGLFPEHLWGDTFNSNLKSLAVWYRCCAMVSFRKPESEWSHGDRLGRRCCQSSAAGCSGDPRPIQRSLQGV